MNTLFIGIDEAGRGPWAGPLVVAGLALFDAKILSEIALLNDSKKLSEKNIQGSDSPLGSKVLIMKYSN